MADLSAYCRALDLEPGASIDQVKIAWRDLAQIWHPDRFASNERLKAKAEEHLKQINESYHRIARVGVADSPSRPASRYQPETHSSGSTEVSHADILAEGVPTWNLWRKKYMDIALRLVGVRLARRALEGVDLREANLDHANLEAADLSQAIGLTDAQRLSALLDSTTKWPR